MTMKGLNMRKTGIFALALVLATLVAASPAAAQATDDIRSPQPPSGNPGAGPAGPVWRGPQALLLDSGPLVTHVGGGFGGADASRLQVTSLAMTTLGSGASVASGTRVADDFTVPAPGWNVSTITFFTYQTGSTTTCTITDARVQIWNGPPNAGGVVVFGDTTTNRFASCAFTNIYRDSETSALNSTRPIMAVTTTVSTNLPAGTYWVDVQLGGSLASGPWIPPITITGQSTTGNAMQWTTAWANVMDTGSATAQGIRFVIDGALAPVELQKFSID